MDLVKLFLSDDPRGADIINLLACMLGALWIIGIKRDDRNSPDWQAWLGFWLGTAAYYLVAALAIVHVADSSKCTAGWIICNVALCNHPTAVPGFISRLGPPFEQFGLNVGTGLLLWAEQSRRPGTARPWVKPIVLVLGASILDFWLACNWGVDHAGVHQALTAFALGVAHGECGSGIKPNQAHSCSTP